MVNRSIAVTWSGCNIQYQAYDQGFVEDVRSTRPSEDQSPIWR